jgi:putative zinc finger/helix-turn-helix YgiT family protein
MRRKALEKLKRPVGAERPFPWRCRRCGKDEVVLTATKYDAKVAHDGVLHAFEIPRIDMPVCRNCGTRVFTEKVDAQVRAALREHLHLLTPDEIRAALARVRMSQKVAARRLGIAEATLSRWLTETQIQSRAMDNLLRVFFAFPQVRKALHGAARRR